MNLKDLINNLSDIYVSEGDIQVFIKTDLRCYDDINLDLLKSKYTDHSYLLLKGE